MPCPKCGHPTRTFANFCEVCGLSLRTAQSDFQGNVHQFPEPERKHITALFSDISGYSKMAERLEPEQVKALSGDVFSNVKKIVSKYEGYIERIIGDGCLVFFGIPRVHEDDPIRGIYAALEIHEMAEALSSHYRNLVGTHLTMHSGINTWLVVTADVEPEKGTYGVAGDAVNVACRLSEMAGPGEILIGAETVRRAKSKFTFIDLGRREVKGKSDQINVFKIVAAKSFVNKLTVDRQVSSAMVGREAELERLELQIRKTIDGMGSVVNVIGEAGIGKSRLIAELKNRDIISSVTLLEGRAISIGRNLSFHPIVDLIKLWAGIAEGDDEPEAFVKLESAIKRIHPQEASEILPFIATLMGMKLTGKHADAIKGIEGEALEKLIFKNVRELLVRGAELRPTIVVMEDLHWADSSSLEFLEALYRLTEKHRITFINVFRPGYFDERSPEASPKGLRGLIPTVEIELRPLDNVHSEALIENMLSESGLPVSVTHKIIDRAGGNPFFIEEVVRSFIDDGFIIRKNGGFIVTDRIDEVVIPPTINGVLTARIDRLEERTRELVKVASVIGRTFFDRIIKNVADSINDVDCRLAYLKEIQLIRDRIRMQELEYLFKHALAQQAAYESTLLEQRKLLHLKVARAIEEIFQQRLHDFYGMLAFHYSKAEDLEKSEHYMSMAGEEALRSSASREALNYFRDALTLYENRCGAALDQNKLVYFEKNLALAHFNRGRASDAVLYFDRVLSRFGYRPPKSKMRLLLRAIYDLTVIVFLLYCPIKLKKKRPTREEIDLLDLMYRKQQSLTMVDNRRMFLEGLSVVRILLQWDLRLIEQGLEWSSTSTLPFSTTGLSFSMTKRFLDRADEIRKNWKGSGEVTYGLNALLYHLYKGSWDTLPKLDKAVLEKGLKSSEMFMAVIYLNNLGTLNIDQGEFAAAGEIAERLFEIGETYDHALARLFGQNITTSIAIRTGRLQDALKHVDEIFSLMDEVGMEPHRLRFLGYKAIAEALLGDIKAAQSTVRKGELLLSGHGTVLNFFLTPFVVGKLITSIRLLKSAILNTSLSDVREIRRTTFRLARWSEANSRKYAPYRTWILRLVGDCHWTADNQKRAFKWYAKSIETGQRLGARPDLSRTYFVVGTRLRDPESKFKKLNDIDSAGYFERAETLFEELGLRSDLAELESVRLTCG